ncbi:ParB/RepB/Spo0J family partition protein [Nevskia sp.]|jgi:ParB family chromosome partitioning protein|uniref:ParB/RepB/Spo0J family partition protein n=1 Tax=Nevskia sp. TaxID=1929292 RepID=UPI003F720CDF
MASGDTVRQIPLDLIRPGSTQARRRFAADALRELSESIRESGIIQPLVLRSIGSGPRREYELLAGERRWRAAQLAGLHEVPALIRDDLDEAEARVLGLIENLQRESLSPIETAEGLRKLGDAHALTHEAIGLRIGKSRAYVTNFLRLLALCPQVQTLLDDGAISLGHAKVLAGLAVSQQLRWADVCVRERLSVRALERRLAGNGHLAAAPAKPDDWQKLAGRLSDHLGYPTVFKPGSGGAGELRVKFHDLDELDGLLARIGYRES